MLALLGSVVLAAQLQESITVTRVLVDVRLVSETESTVMNFGPDDFDVRIGGRKVVVESAEWVGPGAGTDDLRIPMVTDDGRVVEAPVPRGRIIVVLVQTDFTRDAARVEGHLKFLQHSRKLVASLEPDDRVAVFSVDSHLKFRLDLSSDRDKIREAIERAIYIEEPPAPPAVPAPSLAARLNETTLRRATTPESSLRVIAETLRSIPGTKSLILMGWGLGRRTQAGVRMTHEWPAARHALTAARVSIMALDTTYADAHDLGKGLHTAAMQTGGMYMKTHLFPEVAIAELHRMLTGHYELSLRALERIRPGLRTLEVRVNRPGVRVLAPESVVIQP
jgi:hypothetical protein